MIAQSELTDAREETMIRTLVIAGMMVAAGPAFAEMAAPTKPAKPPKETTVMGCTSSGFSGCSLLQVGKQNVMLTAKAGVAVPPAKTFIVAKGTMGAAPPNVCNVTKQFTASKIVATKRKCK
jgi:hypothetical protein